MNIVKLWEIRKEMGIPDHITCLMRNLYVGQETIVRNGHGTMDLFQIGKGVLQGCILSSMEFSRLEYWSGEPFPSPGHLPNPGTKPRSPALQADSLPVEPRGKPKNTGVGPLLAK